MCYYLIDKSNCIRRHIYKFGKCSFLDYADTALYQTHYIENETRFWLGITENFYVLKTVYRNNNTLFYKDNKQNLAQQYIQPCHLRQRMNAEMVTLKYNILFSAQLLSSFPVLPRLNMASVYVCLYICYSRF
jgi:hypothetical protein